MHQIPLMDPRNMINIRDRRFEKLALATAIYSMVLTIFVGAISISSYIGYNLVAEYYTVVILSLIAIALIFQIAIIYFTRQHLSDNDNNIMTIVHILVLSSVTSSMEVSLVSNIAAIITFVLCFITIIWFVTVNSQGIPDQMKEFIAWTWMALLIVIVVFIVISMSKM
ncbi:unnamed protein product [Trifolium pratense]|uniref:Uncharacterized protein n=1 Tax=Trifolium pratense TaxID=57577 RepID=A0ACB0L7R8_TRIPR|nr:unnamed protein product [Trifolium pratense]